jgi:hypothetical protein
LVYARCAVFAGVVDADHFLDLGVPRHAGRLRPAASLCGHAFRPERASASAATAAMAKEISAL